MRIRIRIMIRMRVRIGMRTKIKIRTYCLKTKRQVNIKLQAARLMWPGG